VLLEFQQLADGEVKSAFFMVSIELKESAAEGEEKWSERTEVLGCYRN